MPKQRARQPPMFPPRIHHALRRMIDYAWDGECEDARAFFAENGTLAGHVFTDLVCLDNWLTGRAVPARQYLEDPPDVEA